MNNLDSPREAVPPAAIDFWSTKRATWLSLGALFLLSLPLFFFRLGGWAFFDPDEGRYGEIPRMMLESGDYVTPMLNGVGFFDKPPLLYWGIALSYRLFGISEGAARLIPALAALAAVLGAWALGRRMFGPRAGFFSGAILATCIAWPAMARMVMTDMLVSSLIFLTMMFWWLIRTAGTTSKRTLANFGFWTALALGVLAKGPITIVLFGGSALLYGVLAKDKGIFKGLGWLSGPIWALLVAAPWFVLVQKANPEFNHAFWYEQHIGRFLGKLVEQDHNYGPWYFFVIIPLIFFPWTFFAPAAIGAAWKKLWPGKGNSRTPKAQAALFLCCGVAFVTLFFTGSSSKLVTYILPVLPLMSVALGGYFDLYLRKNGENWGVALRNGTYVLAGLLLIIGIATWSAGAKNLVKNGSSPAPAHWLSLAFLVWAVVTVVCASKWRLRGAIATTAIGFACIFAVATSTIKAVADQNSTKDLVAAIQPGLAKDALVVSQSFTQSLTFYSRERVVMINEPDELRASLPHIPPEERKQWFIKDDEDLKRIALMKTPVYFVSRHSYNRAAEFEKQLDALGGDVEPIVANSRFMFMGNAAARQLTPPVPGVEKYER